MNESEKVAVVIPCYNVKRQILSVLSQIGPEVHVIYLVDDACPEKSAKLVRDECQDPRVVVLSHQVNQGVGGAMLTGYRQALDDKVDIVIKLDGDGQMNPHLIPGLIKPVQMGQADYAKGNRFYDLDGLVQMPWIRVFGNACLSFITKLASGYWTVFDPTNGFTAIHKDALKRLPLGKIDKRFFFESDMLFRLNTIRALVVDIPMAAHYGEEKSNLKIAKIIPEFFYKNGRNFIKRLVYNYYLRDFSVASLEILLGLSGLCFGCVYGVSKWYQSSTSGVPVPSGTVMLSALPIIIGTQMVLAFLNYDVQNVPRKTIQDQTNA